MKSTVQTIAKIILWLEPVALVVIGMAFFYPTPTRTDWLWLLWLLLPVLAARFVLHGRLLTRTPLDGLFAAFLVLGVLNVYAAPYTRGLMMLARPLYGMALCYALVEAARTQGYMRGVLQTVTILSLLIGFFALGATQWPLQDKSRLLRPVADILFRISSIPGVGSGFNPNEITGAMIWLAPMMGVLMVDRWRRRVTRWDVTTAFVCLFSALVLAQSRFAIVGLLGSLMLAAWALISSLRWRLVAAGVLAGLLLLEGGLTFNVNVNSVPAPAASTDSAQAGQDNTQTSPTRDETSFQVRLDIWRSSLEIARDYPLTGIGMGMYRDGRVRQRYPVTRYTAQILPHAHSEIFQILSDMGIPGLGVFLGFYGAAGWMLFVIWRQGDSAARITGTAVATGLLAHFMFGLADAIPLWDRFAFLFWMMLGVLAAQYTLLRLPQTHQE